MAAFPLAQTAASSFARSVLAQNELVKFYHFCCHPKIFGGKLNIDLWSVSIIELSPLIDRFPNLDGTQPIGRGVHSLHYKPRLPPKFLFFVQPSRDAIEHFSAHSGDRKPEKNGHYEPLSLCGMEAYQPRPISGRAWAFKGVARNSSAVCC